MAEFTFQEMELLQPEDEANPNSTSCSSTTAILIHDGGGTVFPYLRMGTLNRNVYGIGNPKFFTGDEFPGGVPEMGKLYAGFIRSKVESYQLKTRRKINGEVDLLLGGWSFGTYLALEVARQLEDDPQINVVGIVMIDADYDVDIEGELPDTVPIDVDEEGKTQPEVLSLRCMFKATRVLENWDPPRWEGTVTGKPPKAVLIRARENNPTKSGKLSAVDRLRGDENLGWSSYYGTMLQTTIDIDGHHFNIFDEAHVEGTTAAVKEALEKLDPIPPRWKMLQIT